MSGGAARPARISTVAIVGHKNSGKTTLTERLVRHFTAQGLRVAAVKHTSDEAGFDKPGRDSDRLARAGAIAVGMVAKNEIGFYTAHRGDTSEGWMEATFAALPQPPDLIIYEGYRGGPHPKVECILNPEVTTPSFTTAQGLIAVVSDHPMAADVPVLNFEPVEEIANVIRSSFGRIDWAAGPVKLH
ncbi:MAG: molybdopterin-guanine dinucleotide biosynthesis protein B [candidate division Zixibacteria bacterium]|nr:molybdopterin-guanine dinucleotide biosynthesis protein B [candidate division Zixibacteria bacterium]